jgi:GxxExxY protein
MGTGISQRGGTEDTEFPLRDLTESILAAAFEVHTHLGAGLLESVYQRALMHELHLRNLPFRAQVDVPLRHKGVALEAPLRLDLVVAEQVIIEVKAVSALERIHGAQVLTYLRLADRPVGLLINFNVPSLRQGIRRIVNTRPNSASSVPLR